MQVIQNHDKILKSPEPIVLVKDLTDSAVHLAIRPWIKNEDFGVVSSDILENCKSAFEEKGIATKPLSRELSK